MYYRLQGEKKNRKSRIIRESRKSRKSKKLTKIFFFKVGNKTIKKISITKLGIVGKVGKFKKK